MSKGRDRDMNMFRVLCTPIKGQSVITWKYLAQYETSFTGTFINLYEVTSFAPYEARPVKTI